MSKFRIVGLGAMGTNLALTLCEKQNVSELEVYDFDVVSKKDLEIFPFYKGMEGMKKVSAFRLYISKNYPHIKLIPNYCRFVADENPKIGWINIDCRDVKSLDADFDFRVSFDGGRLILDSRTKENIPENFYKESKYLSQKNINALRLAAANCCEYIDKRLFLDRTCLVYRLFKGSVFK